MNALPNAGRREKNFGNGPTAVKKAEPVSNNGSNFPGLSSGGGTGDSEEDKIAAMFQASSEQWNKTQEQMAKCVYSFEYDGFFMISSSLP
jgi:protein MPE1